MLDCYLQRGRGLAKKPSVGWRIGFFLEYHIDFKHHLHSESINHHHLYFGEEGVFRS